MRPVFGTAPDGAPEKVRTEMAWASKEPSIPPLHEGRTDIIGPGLWIVLGFRPEFFQARKGSQRQMARLARVKAGSGDSAVVPSPAVDTFGAVHAGVAYRQRASEGDGRRNPC
jgi:hypothetical protein